MSPITRLAVAFCLCMVPALGDDYHTQSQNYGTQNQPYRGQNQGFRGQPQNYRGQNQYYQPNFADYRSYDYRQLYQPRRAFGYEYRYRQRQDAEDANTRRQDNRRQRTDVADPKKRQEVPKPVDRDTGLKKPALEKPAFEKPTTKKPRGYKDDRPNPPDAVAFSGNRKSVQYFFKPGPVIFDDVTTNIGGAYNSHYGVFTAFESGIYLVNYNVVSPRKGAKTAAVDLLRNKEVINSATGSGSSGETSNSAVVFLSRYDKLSVQGRAESAVYCGEGDDAFCSFSVALLKLGNFVDDEKARKVPGW